MTGESRQRVGHVLTRWWRHCDVKGRVFFCMFLLVGAMNLIAYYGLPPLPDGNEGDRLNLLLAVAMFGASLVYLRMGQERWRRKEWARQFEANLAYRIAYDQTYQRRHGDPHQP